MSNKQKEAEEETNNSKNYQINQLALNAETEEEYNSGIKNILNTENDKILEDDSYHLARDMANTGYTNSPL